MKTRFTTLDIMCSVAELQRLIGMRVAQVYDIDHKTYLIKLQRTEEKCVLLLESGNRLHTTGFEWPKNVAPSGFSMKMRKHLRNKRLESMKQLGIDRVVDLQFGSGEAAYHIILELYDRGNIILTDCNLIILNVLRPRTEGEEVRFVVREKYPTERAHQRKVLSLEEVESILSTSKAGDNIKNIFNRNTEYGPAILEHVLVGAGFTPNCKLGKSFLVPQDIPRLLEAFARAEAFFDQALSGTSKGYIIQKLDHRPLPDGGVEDFFSNHEFHPVIFQQHANSPRREFDSFDAAVDEFFSTLESQKIDMKALQQEKEAMKKLENVRKDHSQRLVALEQTQKVDCRRAELIECNLQLVDHVLMSVRRMVASQASWTDIEDMVRTAKAAGDPVASAIHELKLGVNHVSVSLSDPYGDSSEDEVDGSRNEANAKSMVIDIDLDLTAYANARKYYDQKRNAAKKQQKTIDAQEKAYKSAEKKTKQTLKEVQAITHINKARKVFWFEKFHWFISSENYLVIGGRDPQQNELIVKRYLRPGDVYVHADIQGASSIVIKNPSGQPIPPKTLNEAGVMAMSYSVAWDAKVVTSAWWVHHDQVSKTAPTGEYLTTGAFMIRGKKNYLPPSHLIMGFSYLFKLEDGSVERHKDDRKVRTLDDDAASLAGSALEEMSLSSEQDQEIELEGTDDDEEEEGDPKEVKKISSEGDAVDVSGEEEQKEDLSDDASSDDDSTKGSREHTPERKEENEDVEEEAEVKEKDVEFPDIELRIQHTGSVVKVEAPKTSVVLPAQEQYDKEHVVYLGDDKPIVIRSHPAQRAQQKKKGQSGKSTNNKPNVVKEEEEMNTKNKEKQLQQQAPLLKRGQKAKLKKIKSKYKDQDEEDRRLMMEILQSEGKEAKERKKKGKEAKGAGGQRQQQQQKKPRPPPKAPRVQAADGEGVGPEDEEEEEEKRPAAEVDMLDSLTGQPVAEDELLFAIPVVAPYSTLLNYKFKVKLTPGTGKRGKAAKTAMNMFLKDKATTLHEKDLIKSVKDEDLARNLPGKVKVSAPQLQKLRR